MPVIRFPGAVSFSAISLMLVATATCSRSDLYVGPQKPPPPECLLASDCPDFGNLCAPVQCIDPKLFADQLPESPAGVTLPPLVCAVLETNDCDDLDPCTTDACVEETGECDYGPATLDLDNDGHFGPLPGTIPGTAAACGDDCNDASADAFPGNAEICDGVDNDCNGVVDDEASYMPLGMGPVKVSESAHPYGPGGLAYNGSDYLTIYTSGNNQLAMFETMLDATGNKIPPIEETFTFQNADASGGPVVWVGDRFGVAWQDRRDGNYEAYFALLKPDGSKATADTRLSNALGFSVNVELAWNGVDFIVAWQDDRNGLFEILAQRVSVDGAPVGNNISLSEPGGQEDEAPAIASGDQTLGLVYTNGVAGQQVVRFQTFEQNTLVPFSTLINLSDEGFESVYPQIVWNEDHYLVTWYERNSNFKAVFATTVSEDAQIIVPATPISQPPGTARSRDPTVLPLGDRALFVYADNRDDIEGRYELYTRMVDNSLLPLTPEQRLTFAPKDSFSPITTFGPDGDVAVFFKDERLDGEDHVWLTRLGCVAGN
jgi:hypothetical protein